MDSDKEILRANKKIKARLLNFEKEIDEYREALNTEGVWLFLSTLGCWSVTDELLQLFAFAITCILFLNRIWLKLNDRRLFIIRVREIEKQIKSQLQSSRLQKEQLDHLAEIKKKKLTSFAHIKSVPIYLICYLFLMLSISNSFYDFDLFSWLSTQSYRIGQVL